MAANLGDADSQCELGRMYYSGTGTDVNYAKAAEWFQYATNQGCAEGQFLLGRCYENGLGVNKDTKKALELYRKSASQGYKEAKDRLAELQNTEQQKPFNPDETNINNITQPITNQVEELNGDNIYNRIVSLKSQYPEGTPWTNDNKYTWKNANQNVGFHTGRGCMGFAMLASDAAFGNAPVNKYFDINRIKVGDILRINNDVHSVIVLSINGGKVVVAEGNYNSKIHWGREIDLESCEFVYGITRY